MVLDSRKTGMERLEGEPAFLRLKVWPTFGGSLIKVSFGLLETILPFFLCFFWQITH
jgi:hypothetical protein